VASSGKVAIGTTQGDLHDIGKNLVAMMLEGSGYEIVDLGVDVLADKFIQAIRDGADVVAMSALLTTTMTDVQLAIEAIKEAGLRDQVRIIIGGAPITKSYADEIGADGYAEDASSAVSCERGACRLNLIRDFDLRPDADMVLRALGADPEVVRRRRSSALNIWVWLLRDESKMPGMTGFWGRTCPAEVGKPLGYRQDDLISPG
jgi:methylmalonyl-CoA mutase cobalamin-binding subunit